MLFSGQSGVRPLRVEVRPTNPDLTPPCIAIRMPAYREVLRDGAAGELLPPGDVDAWVGRL